MFITGNFDRLAVKGEQADDPAHVFQRQTGIGVEGKRVFFRKADNTTTRIVVVVMRLEAALGWCRWCKIFVEIIMSAIPGGIPV